MNQDNDRLTSPDGDAEVSAIYRELAAERAPERLDRAVLNEAAAAARPARSRGPIWLRPLAFVATVGLSIAVVLEVSQSPDMSIPPSAEPYSMDEAERVDAPATTVMRDAPVAGGDDMRQQQSLSVEEAVIESDFASVSGEAAQDFAPKRDSANYADVLTESRARIAELKEEESAAQSVGRAELQVADADAAMESTKAAAARHKVSVSREAPPVADTAPSFMAEAAFTASPAIEAPPAECEEELRVDAGRWWACIEALRASGEKVVADNELEAFREAFPDYQPAD